ncbi:ABC transporter ATP-binding protein [Hypericibacter sp.]|uniref:ABC transporter ATP-binding protein n=1 Tax=Hypericibacter sp. TaxID=2705401 RepID=UPI003D6D6E12
MTLELQKVTKRVGNETHLADISLVFEPGTLNVLLGPTLSGKTSLMRMMASLDKPTSGRVLWRGQDVTGVDVRKRNVAMVYQQFINYPTLSVYENIASPLRVAGRPRAEIERKVKEVAALMRLEGMLDRTPLELSGGQQQRTAIARALAKGAELVLFDEPLANLDYKLREELRNELPRVFAGSQAIFVYATAEPSEALLLGGSTVTLNQGQVTQFGPTIELYRRPNTLRTAQVFSDPPMNEVRVTKRGSALQWPGNIQLPVSGPFAALADGDYIIGVRPNHVLLDRPASGAMAVRARVAVSEITGSESFVHVDWPGGRWVALVHGVRRLEVESDIEIYLDPNRFFVFRPDGALVSAPAVAS